MTKTVRGVKLRNGPGLVLFFQRFPLRHPFPTILLGLIIYALGALISGLSDMLQFFIQEWIIVAAVFGFIWVSSVFCWAFTNYGPMLRKMGPNFRISDDEYNQLLEGHLKTVYSDKNWIFSSLPGITLGLIGFFAYSRGIFVIPTPLIAQMLLSIPAYFAYSAVVISLVAYLGCSGAFLLIAHCSFMRKLGKYPVKVSILQVRRTPETEPLAKFSFYSSMTWFVGVSIYCAAIIRTINLVVITLLAVIVTIGLLAFFIPQWSIHGAIVRGKHELLKKLCKEFNQKFKVFEVTEKKNNMIGTLASWCILFSEAEKIQEWSFGVSMLGKVSISAFLPIASTAIGVLLRI